MACHDTHLVIEPPYVHGSVRCSRLGICGHVMIAYLLRIVRRQVDGL